MIPKPLPPLNALRAFEATARLLSVTEAASELHVTPPAISHQLKALEDYIGFPLFQRLHKGITLTEKGETYFFRIARQLSNIARATDAIIGDSSVPRLTLAVPPHFFTGWIVPRLPKLIPKNLLANVRFVDTVRKIKFDTEGIDAQIAWGSAGWSGLISELLIDDKVCVACSPGFLDQHGPISSLQDLTDVPLIYTEGRPIDWELVLEQAGIERSASARSLTFIRPLPAVEAARSGLGVAITSHVCIADLIEAGELVIPFDAQIRSPSRLSYTLVRPPHASSDTRLDKLRDSFRAELALTTAGY